MKDYVNIKIIKRNNVTIQQHVEIKGKDERRMRKWLSACEISGHPVIRDDWNSCRMTKFTNLVIRRMTNKFPMLKYKCTDDVKNTHR